MDVAAAAKDGDLLLFALVLAGSVITILVLVVAYLVKDKLKAYRQQWDKLEARLSAGAETMKQIREEQHRDREGFSQLNSKLQNIISEFYERFVDCRTFDAFQEKLDERVRVAESKVEHYGLQLGAIKDQLGKVEKQLDNMMDLLSKIITVGGRNIIAPSEIDDGK